MYAIVKLSNGQIVPQRGQLSLIFDNLIRVNFPIPEGSGAVHHPTVGYEWPPQYGEKDEPPVQFRLYEVTLDDRGTGPVVTSVGDPVFNPMVNTVTITRTLEAAPPPPTPDEIIGELLNTPQRMAIAKFAAKKFGITLKQLKDALKAEL